MALTFASLTNGTDTTASHGSCTTASITPTGNKLILLAYFAKGTITADPTVAGCGLTWVLVGSTRASSTTWPIFLYRAMGASPTTEGVTITLGGGDTVSNSRWQVVEWGGNVDTSGANGANAVVQSKSAVWASMANPHTITFDSTFGTPSNGAFAAFIAGTGYTATPRAGWTESVDFATSGVAMMETQYRTSSDTAAEASFSGTGSVARGIAVEIKDTSGVTPTYYSRYYNQLIGR